MTRFFGFLLALLLAAVPATAQIVPSLPFNLQNNTTADATQVQANFNTISTNVNANAAKNGVNSDITALLGLSTTIPPAGGGTTEYVGATGTGSGNVQVVSTTTPSAFGLVAGNRVVYTAGFTNSGATTLNVSGSGATAVFKPSAAGPVALTGGEIVAGNSIQVVYDGTQFQMVTLGTACGLPLPIGLVVDYAGTTAPTCFVLANGSAISRTTYSGLFAVISTTYGVGNGTTTYNIPDLRGRVVAGNDAMGISAAGRLTGTTMTPNGTTNGATGGTQTHLLDTTELPSHTHPGVNSGGVIQTTQTDSGSRFDYSTAPTINGNSGATGGGLAHLNTQPTLVMSKMIFTGVP